METLIASCQLFLAKRHAAVSQPPPLCDPNRILMGSKLKIGFHACCACALPSTPCLPTRFRSGYAPKSVASFNRKLACNRIA